MNDVSAQALLELPRLPLPLRVLNSAARALRRRGLEPVSLSPAALLAAARRAAGADDFGQRDFERGLEVLVESAERDANLTLVGRLGLRGVIVNALATRLLRERLRTTRPELFRTELAAPLIVIGLPRSGTTLLHRLLALAPGARALAHWEVRRPLPGPGRDRRAAEVQRALTVVRRLAPELELKHSSLAGDPEECMFLLDSTLVSASFWVTAPVYSYLDWYLEQDQAGPYRVYREHLQVFQAAEPRCRLTLKAPIHMANVEPLLAAIPNAKIVQLHRDPVAVLGSVNSLFYTLHRVVTERVDLPRLGKANLELIGRGMERHIEARGRLPSDAIVDVYYDDLIREPLETVRSIYDRLGFVLAPEFELRLRRFIEQNPQHKHGRHRYRVDAFALSDAEIRARLAGYLERFPRVAQRS
jgi:hypothetical protein